MQEKQLADDFRKDIQKQLLKVGVIVKSLESNIHFDSEEACNRQHQGQWDIRLKLNVSNKKAMKAGRIKH
jgi:hypothetical protein